MLPILSTRSTPHLFSSSLFFIFLSNYFFLSLSLLLVRSSSENVHWTSMVSLLCLSKVSIKFEKLYKKLFITTILTRSWSKTAVRKTTEINDGSLPPEVLSRYRVELSSAWSNESVSLSIVFVWISVQVVELNEYESRVRARVREKRHVSALFSSCSKSQWIH